MANVQNPEHAVPDHVPEELVWDNSLVEFTAEMDDPFIAGARPGRAGVGFSSFTGRIIAHLLHGKLSMGNRGSPRLSYGGFEHPAGRMAEKYPLERDWDRPQPELHLRTRSGNDHQ